MQTCLVILELMAFNHRFVDHHSIEMLDYSMLLAFEDFWYNIILYYSAWYFNTDTYLFLYIPLFVFESIGI